MKLFSRLRQVALEHQRLLRLQNSLAHSVIVAVCANQCYLQVTLENEHGQCQEGFVDITDWLAAQRAALPGMPWREIPLDYLCPLLQESVGSVALYEQTWTLREVPRAVDPITGAMADATDRGAPPTCISIGRLKFTPKCKRPAPSLAFCRSSCAAS